MAQDQPSRSEVLWACGLIALALLVTTLLIVPDDPAKPPPLTPRVALAESSTAKGFTIRAWLSGSRVYRDQTVRLRFLLENHTANAITGIHLADLQVPGFVPPAAAAWRTTPLNARIDALADLAPGESESLETDLSPTIDSYGTFSPAALFRWISVPPAPAKPEQAALPITVGPIEIINGWKTAVSFGRRLYNLVKDFALPIALAVLAFLFQRWQAAKAKQEADLRESGERKLQVWKMQLDRLHYNAEHHYLPIIRSCRQLRTLLLDKQAPALPADQIWEHLYWLLMIFARVQRLRNEKGGIFFQDHGGEEVVQLAWWLFDWHVKKRFTLDTRERAVRSVNATEDFSAFLVSARHNPLLVECRGILKNWFGETQSVFDMAPLLDILLNVFHFETNRPFDVHWYGVPEKFELQAKYHIPSDPNNTEVQKKAGMLKKTLEAYYNSTTEYVGSFVREPRG
jgi:hypothetical protein